MCFFTSASMGGFVDMMMKPRTTVSGDHYIGSGFDRHDETLSRQHLPPLVAVRPDKLGIPATILVRLKWLPTKFSKRWKHKMVGKTIAEIESEVYGLELMNSMSVLIKTVEFIVADATADVKADLKPNEDYLLQQYNYVLRDDNYLFFLFEMYSAAHAHSRLFFF